MENINPDKPYFIGYDSPGGLSAWKKAFFYAREEGVSYDLIERMAYAIAKDLIGMTDKELNTVQKNAIDEQKSGRISKRYVRWAVYMKEVFARAGLPWDKVRSDMQCRLAGDTLDFLREEEKKAPEEKAPEDGKNYAIGIYEEFKKMQREQAAKERAEREALNAVLADSNSVQKAVAGEPTFEEILAKNGFELNIEKPIDPEKWVGEIMQEAKRAEAGSAPIADAAETGKSGRKKRTKIKGGVKAFAEKYVELAVTTGESVENG